ncbi:hypothetical protein ACXZ65_38040 [Streptomyces aculeolatus]
MLTEALAALAASGGTALVGAMATDAWQATRNSTARLFGRQGSERQAAIEAQLDGNVVLVERAGDPDLARQGLVSLWQMELIRLLEEHPEAEAELQELIAHVRDALPATQQQWVQNNIARDHSRQFAVQGGNIIYHESPSSASGQQQSAPHLGAADDSSDSPR